MLEAVDRNPTLRAVMTMRKNVLLIGLDPAVVDYAKWPGLTPEKLRGGLEGDVARMGEAGYDARLCFVDHGQTAAATVEAALAGTRFDAILIGAGVRTDPAELHLFERLINLVHEKAPGARICFNTGPTDSLAAVQRWA
jgi:hypothetical protein